MVSTTFTKVAGVTRVGRMPSSSGSVEWSTQISLSEWPQFISGDIKHEMSSGLQKARLAFNKSKDLWHP